MPPDNRQERLVRAAFRGIMEAVLSLDVEPEVRVNRQAKVSPKLKPPRQKKPPVSEDIPFPSVSKYEESLFGETMPISNMDIDMALEAVSRARAMEAKEEVPHVQPGPGESEVATGWAIPQP